MKFLLIALSVTFRSAAELVSKAAAIQSTVDGGTFFNFWLFLVFAFLLLQTAAWTVALKKLPLVFAYPFMSLALPLTFFGSVALFDEAVSPQRVVGICLIVCGIVLSCWPARGQSTR